MQFYKAYAIRAGCHYICNHDHKSFDAATACAYKLRNRVWPEFRRGDILERWDGIQVITADQARRLVS